MLDPSLTNKFFYKTKLFRGFKYRYNFSVGDQFVVDPDKAVSEDRLGKVTNFVEVPSSEEEEKNDQDLESAL